MAEYLARLWQWGPLFVRTTLAYIAVALVLHEALAARGILTRYFETPASLRFGLPAGDAEFARLGSALREVVAWRRDPPPALRRRAAQLCGHGRDRRAACVTAHLVVAIAWNGDVMRSLLVAIGFLTRLPVPASVFGDARTQAQSLAWYPLVGVLLGSLLYVFAWLLHAVECTKVESARIHHRLHRAESGDDEALECGTRFRAAAVLERGGVERQGAITRAFERFDDPREIALRRVPDDACASRRRVDLHARDAEQCAERALDQPDAGRAAQAIDEHDRLAATVAEIAHDVAHEFRAPPSGGIAVALTWA